MHRERGRIAGGWWLAIGGLILSACAEAPARLHAGQVRVAPDLVLTLPSPASLGRRLEVAQLVVARHGDRNAAFEGRISAAPDRFDLVCIDPLGRKAMSIRWTPEGIVTERAPWVPEDLQPENMLADIVLLYWPAVVVGQALALSGGKLTADPRVRSIRVRGQEVIHAEYRPLSGDDPWNGRLSYRNLPWGYSLDIQSRIIGP